jgi:tetratricopeptide (TPR) repeat protein
MLASTDFAREAGRGKEFAPVLVRVNEARSAAASVAASRPAGGSGSAGSGDIDSRVMASDSLIRQRKYSEAKPILEQVLSKTPDNARALYGMAQVVNQLQSREELDANADENDKIQAQHDRLEKAIKLYREAIQKADPRAEGWIIQWSHVLIARILDFQEFRNDALAEYSQAVEMGELPSGAYKEALEGKQHPFGQK